MPRRELAATVGELTVQLTLRRQGGPIPDFLWEGLLSRDVLNLGAQHGVRRPRTGSRKAAANKSGSSKAPTGA